MATQAAQGKALLAESRYEEAIEQFTIALKASPTSPDYLIQRSTAYQRAKRYTAALEDAEAGIIHAQARAKRELIVQGQLRRAMALFSLERYGDAKFALDIVKSKDPKEKSLNMWLMKAEAKLKALGPEDEKSKVTISEMPAQKAVPEVKHTSPESQPTAVQSTSIDKIRHEWYQSSASISLSLLAKGVPKDKTTVEITEGAVSIQFPIEAAGKDYDFTIDPLFAAIDPAKSTYKILPSKIDITLIKATPGQKWHALEGTEPISTTSVEAGKQEVPKAVLTQAPAVPKGPVYPTSSKSGPKDWDKITSDEKDDIGGGDEAMHFFKQLYKDASPETQRAMMKSYSESNGTALSTNWEEVKKAPVETTPPDGMVSKKW